MYIQKFKRILHVQPNGILHVGAHKAEELQEYEANKFCGKGKIYWVEGQTDLFNELSSRLDRERNVVIQAYAWNLNNEEITFNVTNKTASSSLFNLDQHLVKYPEIYVKEKIKIYTSRLDAVLPKDAKFDYVALDIQGSELKALEGLGRLLDQVKWIYTEVSRERLYENAPLLRDMDDFLFQKGFKRRFTAWDRKANWGDALYIHKSIFKNDLITFVRSSSWQFSRFARSFIPQFMFPLLVKIKHRIKGSILK